MIILTSCQKDENKALDRTKSDTVIKSDTTHPAFSTESELNTKNIISESSENQLNNDSNVSVPHPQKINIDYKLEKIKSQNFDLNYDKKIDFLVFYRATKNHDTTYFLSIFLNNNDKLEDIYYYELPKNLTKIEDAIYSYDNIIKIRYRARSNPNIINEQYFQFTGVGVKKID
ncbi:MAG TPA: hypothetical protein PLC04_02625 [Candidatus Kapabacteria bacterium]|nr:hypothetical protein [Candidatus Kapabacteria bacterium]HOV91962.1 hypothetical protein [Candidatus Kapabacteria bacterium]